MGFTSRLLGCGRLVAIGALLLPSLAGAQAPVNPEEARKQLENDRGRLEATQRRSKEMQAEMDKLAAERERINSRLVETGKLIQQSEAQLGLDRVAARRSGGAREQVRGSLEERHGSISALLAAMQRMGRNPPPVMVTQREDALSMVRSAMLLAAAFPELRGEAVALSEQLNTLIGIMTSIRSEGEKLRTETRGSTMPAFAWPVCKKANANPSPNARRNWRRCARPPPTSPKASQHT